MKHLFLLSSFFVYLICNAQEELVITGAMRTENYVPFIKDKRIGLVVNQTSVIGTTHLVDSLKTLQLNLKKIFAPEHGFRGNKDAGAFIDNSFDAISNLYVISIYGNKKAPDSSDLADIDILIFDIQDVGARFYTYISTLQYVMESCAKYHKTLWLLDRPNPNGFYIDGPVLEKKYKSFVGMQPVPVVYGLTIGEYAMMLNGEHWLKDSLQCDLHVVSCLNYTHKTIYQLPVNPSPNLVNMTSIYLYPTLCFFEGTPVSVGRGTDKPFQIVGYPNNPKGNFQFTPMSKPGATSPMYMNKLCSGFNLQYYNTGYFINKNSMFLSYIIDFYKNYPDKSKFFTDFFDTLAGTDKFRKDIINNKTEFEIRNSWKTDIDAYKIIRKKYLLYPDFE